MSKFTRYLIGMDCGTTNIKAVVLRSDGQIVATESRPSRFISNGKNTQEQDANEWWESAADIFRCLTDRIGEEGTAFALRHVIETVRLSGGQAESLRVCGGGAKSRTWNKIKASVLNMPVYVLSEDSGNVPVGSALIVGHKVGIFPDLSEVTSKVVKVAEVIQPDPEWAAAYDRVYPFYVSMYQHLDEDLRRLEQVMQGAPTEPAAPAQGESRL